MTLKDYLVRLKGRFVVWIGIYGSGIFGVGKYFHSKSTRPFLITKKGI